MNIIRNLTRILPDKIYLQLMYFKHFHRWIDFKNPVTFNEKLQWLKIYDRKPEYTTMVDKYLAKKYVAEKIGEQYIIPTLGVWEKAEDIDFDALPNQFVLKCNNDSGGIVICKDKSKLDREQAIHLLSSRLKNNGFWYGREWPYKNVKPCIIAEKYMEDTRTGELRDYKFFCFGGQVRCYKVDFDRFIEHHANYYDRESRILKLGEVAFPPVPEKELETPQNIELMIKLAEKLADQIPFLRADFYDVSGKVYFGELTFYPASGLGELVYEENDETMGSWIKLPEKMGGGYILVDKGMIFLLGRPSQKNGNGSLRDYKIYTMNGEAKFCMINQDRGFHTRADYFDRDYEWMDFVWGYDHADVLPKKPQNYELMFELAEKLAVGITELRVDFYEVDGQVYFGELTFFDGSGFNEIEPAEWDYKFGNMICLPQ